MLGTNHYVNQEVKTTAMPYSKQKTEGQLEIRLATTAEDIRNAYNLVYRQYREYKLIPKNRHESRVITWNLLPSSFTLIAERDGKLCGTLSFIQDSSIGLPSDKSVSTVLNGLRESQRHLCELSGFAIEPDCEDSSTVLMELMRYAHYMNHQHVFGTDWIIVVSPKHAAFYKTLLCFLPLSDPFDYPFIQTNKGVAMWLDMVTAEETYFRRHGHRAGKRNVHHFFFVERKEEFIKHVHEDMQLYSQLITWEMIRKFAEENTNILEQDKLFNLLSAAWQNREQKTFLAQDTASLFPKHSARMHGGEK